MNELKARGVEDILIAVVDGLKGFPEAIEAVFPQAAVQTCIVHLIRNSLDFVSWKDRKPVVAELRKIYRAADAETGRKALEAFEGGPWGGKYAAIGQIWRRQWEQVIPFFAFAPAVRKIVYTTNAIEALNATLRRAVRARGHFPSDEAATKLIFLVLRQVAQQWKMPPREWAEAKTQFAIISAIASSEPDGNPAPRTRFPTVPHKGAHNRQSAPWSQASAEPAQPGRNRVWRVSDAIDP